MRTLVAAIALLAALPVTASARPGDLDRRFDGDGRVVGGEGWQAQLVRTLPGGGVLTTWPAGGLRPLTRFDARGRRLPRSPGLAAEAAVAAGTGALVLGFHEHGPVLARVQADGSPDTSYGASGEAAIPTPGAWWTPSVVVADSAGGALVMGTSYDDARQHSFLVLARLTPTGAPDAAFGNGGLLQLRRSAYPRAGVLRPDGSAVIALTGKPELLELQPGGARRKLPLPGRARIYDAALLPDRAGLLAGYAGRVVRLRADGRLDRRFPRIRRVAEVAALDRDSRGRLVVASNTGDSFGRPHAVVRRFGRRGTLQFRTRIRPHKRSWTGSSVTTALVDARNRILVAGALYDGDLYREDYGDPHPLVARLLG